jgi:hypothetical protein
MKVNYLSLCSRGSANPGFILISGQCILAILLLASVYSISMPKKWKKKNQEVVMVWLPLAMGGHTRPHMAMYGHAWPCTAISTKWTRSAEAAGLGIHLAKYK